MKRLKKPESAWYPLWRDASDLFRQEYAEYLERIRTNDFVYADSQYSLDELWSHMTERQHLLRCRIDALACEKIGPPNEADIERTLAQARLCAVDALLEEYFGARAPVKPKRKKK